MTRITLTDPDCPQSVRDQINGAAQPTTQAIQQAREIAAGEAEEWAEALRSLARTDRDAQCLPDEHIAWFAADFVLEQSQALSVSASEREELEALREYAQEATKAITSLTAGGSEYFKGRIGEIYVADLPFCLERIRASKLALHNQLTATRAALNGAKP